MMRFDIEKFAEEFRDTIDWMLRDRHAKEIKDDLQLFKNNKNSLQMNPDSPDALRMIIELIVTKGWRLKKPANFDSKMDSFINKHRTNFRTSIAKEELNGLFGNWTKQNIEKLLTNYSTIEQFTKELYDLAKQGKTEVLGEKGRDNYLRDFGYLDRIPMDRHEMRFIIRTGIYHANSVRNKSDPLKKSSLHESLTQFCSKYLGGKTVEEIDLGTAPGLVDIFIWTYCTKDRYSICGSSPKCNVCKLKRNCLYVVTNQL